MRRDARDRGGPHIRRGPHEARIARRCPRRRRRPGAGRRAGGEGGTPAGRRRGDDRREQDRKRLRLRRGRVQPVLSAGARHAAAGGCARRGDARPGRPGGLLPEGVRRGPGDRLLSRGLAPLEADRRNRGESEPRARALLLGLPGGLGRGLRVRVPGAHERRRSRRRRGGGGHARLRSGKRHGLREPGVSVRDGQVRGEGRRARRAAVRDVLRSRRRPGLLQRRPHGGRGPRDAPGFRRRRRAIPRGLRDGKLDRLHEPRLPVRARPGHEGGPGAGGRALRERLQGIDVSAVESRRLRQRGPRLSRRDRRGEGRGEGRGDLPRGLRSNAFGGRRPRRGERLARLLAARGPLSRGRRDREGPRPRARALGARLRAGGRVRLLQRGRGLLERGRGRSRSGEGRRLSRQGVPGRRRRRLQRPGDRLREGQRRRSRRAPRERAAGEGVRAWVPAGVPEEAERRARQSRRPKRQEFRADPNEKRKVAPNRKSFAGCRPAIAAAGSSSGRSWRRGRWA